MKKSTFKTVNIDLVKSDRSFLRVWTGTVSPKFFIKAVKKYSHYTNPVAYEKDGFYYLLGHKSSLDALIENGEKEVLLEIINIADTDIIHFIIIFLTKEHKALDCTARLIKLILDYAQTAEGKKWFNSVCDSQDKEVQVATILDISHYAAKRYLKLIQPGNEEYLELLADQKNWSLSTAYNKCVAEKQPQPTPEKPVKNRGTKVEEDKPADGSTESHHSEDENETPEPNNGSVRVPKAEEPGPILAADELQRILDDYKLNSQQEDEVSQPEQEFALKVIVDLSDGSKLELPGKIDIIVDGTPIRSTEQLVKGTNGIWRLPVHHSPISLMVYPEEDEFFSDF